MSTHDEADSFDEFVRSRSTALLRSAYLLTTDRHAAEDLLQDVLERLYAKWRRARSAPDTYARKILVNRAIDRWRFRGRRPEAPLDERTGAPALDHADHVVVRQTVLAALRTLPARQRAAVVLRYLDDLSEAADVRFGGDPTRTVVHIQPLASTDPRFGPVITVYGDEVDRTAPLPVAVRLPVGRGWLVARKDAALSYLDHDGRWHAAGRNAALLPPTATRVRVDATEVALP
ncbi:SigE family RNA polymerase sigma factor [Micromonospora siamensis]|uniref:RNA polymerase sigma factor, sigma-70 family n=1 Tax=Micromonospora siamensis TaxID=299152 RepID=A0A1C5JN38_9ACTN|nr:SigE family RNA polymerase sigma factor [Micromonospora siamensis]SCG71893.1 RNA polymerase sigma factor, sigma-70 family [Micromonospora siamensis]